jgi:ADP-heptose:LPS heptosyltransferase
MASYNDSFDKYLKKWTAPDADPQEVAKAYLPLAKDLLYADEELVRQVIDHLRGNILRWAKQHSMVYRGHDGIITKKELEDKPNWYVTSTFSSISQMQTSGTTTGYPFSYLRWNPAFLHIEAENHYDLILDEFDVPQNPEILYFLLNHRWTNDLVWVTKNPTDLIERHGVSRRPTVHVIQNHGLFDRDREGFYDKVLEYISEHKFDVLTIMSQYLHSLIHHIRRTNFKGKLAGLLSHTGNMLLDSDREYLKKAGLFDHICDHMRCWDGGAGFFQCKHGTYHLMDQLAYCRQGSNRLISTDYFSFPSPFIEYWNGDNCEIGEDYHRCDCGRLYRKFRFLESRPYSLKGKNINLLSDEIAKVTKWVCQLRCEDNAIEVMSRVALSDEEQQKVRKILDGFGVVFQVEQYSTQTEGDILTRNRIIVMANKGSTTGKTTAKTGLLFGGLNQPLERGMADALLWQADAVREPQNVIIDCYQGLGDFVVLSALVRSMHVLWPGRFNVEVRGWAADDIFRYSKDTVPLSEGTRVVMNFPMVDANHNYLSGICQDTTEQLGVRIYPATMQPHIYLSDQEKNNPPYEPPFILINAGTRSNTLTKKYPTPYYQEIVDFLVNRGIKVIQIGDTDVPAIHPNLKGAISRVNSTSIRELCVLAGHAIGSIGSVTGLLHIQAAFNKPYWCLSGGRETPNFYSWPTTRVFHTIGYLDCCMTKGCWKTYVDPNNVIDEDYCVLPVVRDDGEWVPKCMELIKPTTVINNIRDYLEAQKL